MSRRTIILLALAVGAGVTAHGAVAAPADLCLPVGKLPPGITLPPGTKSPPGFVRLPPGITIPGCGAVPVHRWLAGTGKPGKGSPAGSGPAQYAGTVGGTPLPAPGAGRGGVLALALPGGEVAAASAITSAGRYSLKLPPGTYALVTWIADLKRGTFTEVASALVHANAGQARTLPLSTTLRKRRHTSGLDLPPGFGTVPPPGGEKWVTIDTFPGGTGEHALLEKGVQDMLTVDLVNAAAAEQARSGCVVKVSSLNNRVEDLVNELRLQQTPVIDPATTVPTGHWVAPNVEVRGGISDNATNHTVTASIAIVQGGQTIGTASHTVSDDDVFDLSPLLAKDVIKALCSVPTSYTATLDGTAHLARSPGEDLTVTWSGTMELSKLEDGPGPAPGTWRMYGVESGTVQVTISGSEGPCSVNGSANGTAGVTDGNLMVRTDGAKHPYMPHMAWAGESVPITLTGDPNVCHGQGDLPLNGADWAWLDSPADSDSYAFGSSADLTVGPGFTEHMHWVFAPHDT